MNPKFASKVKFVFLPVLVTSIVLVLAFVSMQNRHEEVQNPPSMVLDTIASQPNKTPEQLASALVGQMTLDEKLSQLINSSPAIPRLKIPVYQWWSEALHGANTQVASTNFPEPIGLAASFDQSLVHNIAAAISQEVRGAYAIGQTEGTAGMLGNGLMGNGLDVWAPNLNIFRDPRWGRGQETYGEDPYLTGQMALAYVTGMQGANPEFPDVIATPKHFAVYSGPEATRHKANVIVSMHDLEDTYLPAFRMAIVDGHAGSIMCSYNSVNGQPACANDFLLKTTLRDAWGFKGYVVSDCRAIDDIAQGHEYAPNRATAIADAITAGMDNECAFTLLNTPKALIKRDTTALSDGALSEHDVNKALIRLYTARFALGSLGAIDGRAAASGDPAQLNSATHRALALQSAEESIVLLKNASVLPLKTPGMKIAVIGPLADATRVLRGNYSSGNSAPPISVLGGIRAEFPNADVQYVPSGPSYTDGDPIPTSTLFTDDGKPGLTASYYKSKAPLLLMAATFARANFIANHVPVEATSMLTRVVPSVDMVMGLDPAGLPPVYQVVWTGVLVPAQTGTYRLGLKGANGTLIFDGKPLAHVAGLPADPMGDLRIVHLERGQRYPIKIVALKTGVMDIHLVWTMISENPDAEIIAAAKNADVVIAVVGLTSDIESEQSSLDIPGFFDGDRTTLDLPPDEEKMLEIARENSKKLIVVLMSGSAVNLSWEKKNADAILEAWYPGEEGGAAVARVLSGAFNPAGRLPVTFYQSVSDLPPFADYSMQNRTYRYFTGTPVYPFGYGLSYTAFDYGNLVVRPGIGTALGDILVQASITNSGKVPGDEVAQLYLQFPDSSGAPRIALRGFRRVHLAAGARQIIEFQLTPRDLSSVSPEGKIRVLAGRYQVSVGGGQPNTGVPFVAASFSLDRTIPIAQ